MKSVLISKKSTIELALLIGVDIVLYFFWSFEVVVLFSLGFIWNWVAAQDLNLLLQNRRYRFSMVKTVVNLQILFLKPFARFPAYVQSLVKALPAGIFWTLVILFNESLMPWWATFLGSLGFEILQVKPVFKNADKEAAQ